MEYVSNKVDADIEEEKKEKWIKHGVGHKEIVS